MDEDSPWGDQPSSRPQSIKTAQESTSTSDENASIAPKKESTTPSARKTPSKAARTTRRFGTQSTTLEALDDSLGPLGPLGVEPTPVAQPPPPANSKDLPLAPGARSSPTLTRNIGQLSPRGAPDGIGSRDDQEARDPRARVPPPVAPSPIRDSPQRTLPAHVSIEQAAKPTFDIAVGDPHKVGDLTGSHTVYQVRTKTSSKAYRTPDFSVTRRYRDFLWLYTQLHHNNPGIVVPPPPDKQTVGRFDLHFVETRRAALERMLNKTAAHPILQHDSDLKLFLESEAFSVDVKHKERKDVGLPESKGGVLSTIGINVGSATKFIEHDDWFHDRRIYLDALENQLKALLKSTDAVVAQRKALADSASDFSVSLHSLAEVELSPDLSGPLDGLSDVQLRIRELYSRQALQDELTLAIVIDEYIRLIGSIGTAFEQRQKAFHSWHASESALGKTRNAHEKLLRSGRSQQDRLSQTQAEVADAERRVHQARLLFEDMGRLMRIELERFEREKVEDFKSGVETFLESAVEAQKELIEIWETYLMQFDAKDQQDAVYIANGNTSVDSAQDKAARGTAAIANDDDGGRGDNVTKHNAENLDTETPHDQNDTDQLATATAAISVNE